MPVFLHLRIKVSDENLPRLQEFLRRAIPIYESPGGIRVRLLKDPDDSSRLIELIEYATVEDYEADQGRITENPEQYGLLAEWRQLLDEPPVVEVWFDV